MAIQDSPVIGSAGQMGAMRLMRASVAQDLLAYGRDGSKLGTVEHLMIDMFGGRVEYAVLSFGGFLGLGQKYHPVPFAFLRLSTDGAGYIVDVDRELIDGSPSYRKDDAPAFDEAYGHRIRSYYEAKL